MAKMTDAELMQINDVISRRAVIEYLCDDGFEKKNKVAEYEIVGSATQPSASTVCPSEGVLSQMGAIQNHVYEKKAGENHNFVGNSASGLPGFEK